MAPAEAAAAAVMHGISKDPARRFESCRQCDEAMLAELPSDPNVQKRQLMCPRCGRLLKVQHAWAGKRGSCPKCDGALSISADGLTLWLPEDRSGPVSLTSPDFDIGRLAATPSNGLELPKNVWRRAWRLLKDSVVVQAVLAALLLLLMLGGLAAW